MLTFTPQSVSKLLVIMSICVLAVIMCLRIPLFSRALNQYAQHSMQEYYGAAPVSPMYETKILEIAKEMGIGKPIIIRKMNTTSMGIMGYYNAFAAFYLFLHIFPLVDTPFLFISEGFFEDLSESEQRFLIGHELTHIKEEHTRYLSLSMLLFFILFFALLRSGVIKINLYVPLHHRKWIKWFLNISTAYVCFLVTYSGACIYRRHIEWQADMSSLVQLQTREGGIKLVERWQRDFNMPTQADFFSGHPTCAERRKYLLEYQKTSIE